MAQTGSVDPMETLQDAVLKADEKLGQALRDMFICSLCIGVKRVKRIKTQEYVF